MIGKFPVHTKEPSTFTIPMSYSAIGDKLEAKEKKIPLNVTPFIIHPTRDASNLFRPAVFRMRNPLGHRQGLPRGILNFLGGKEEKLEK